jgi:RecA-family ATPase
MFMNDDVLDSTPLPVDDREENPFDNEPEPQPTAAQKKADLFPRKRVHLIGGTSGAGKTTLLLQWLAGWMKGQSALGFREDIPPMKWISYDRGPEDFQETCARIGVDPKQFNFYAPPANTFANSLKADLAGWLDREKGVRFLIIEGIQVKTPQGKINDMTSVATFMRGLGEFCESRDLTIIGTIHAAKTHEGDRYTNPRQRLAGSVAWAGFASTVIIVEEAQEESENSARRIFVLPRNGKNIFFEADFKDGMLVRKTAPKSAATKIEEWLLNQPIGSTFTRQQAKDGSGISSEQTFGNELNRIVKLGKAVQPVPRGPYKRIK